MNEKPNEYADFNHKAEAAFSSIGVHADGGRSELSPVDKGMIGYVTMWTTAQGLTNMINNKIFNGYDERSKANRIQISVPHTAVMMFEEVENVNGSGELKFYCHNKDLW
ncbi:hypothetical protein MOB65_20020 [Bacillus inaquosorum]|uniref:hypothetical protein n=1 Tax=Bacillus inaquosorum TaxID=483913 RepID=UPI002280116B|nr:hypothetical protein [Bacillus inaquosorum]MCY7911144.1 hypothetical protein [Bacillus inaquosorum]